MTTSSTLPFILPGECVRGGIGAIKLFVRIIEPAVIIRVFDVRAAAYTAVARPDKSDLAPIPSRPLAALAS
jgi:hypothetical protein